MDCGLRHLAEEFHNPLKSKVPVQLPQIFGLAGILTWFRTNFTCNQSSQILGSWADWCLSGFLRIWNLESTIHLLRCRLMFKATFSCEEVFRKICSQTCLALAWRRSILSEVPVPNIYTWTESSSHSRSTHVTCAASSQDMDNFNMPIMPSLCS